MKKRKRREKTEKEESERENERMIEERIRGSERRKKK